MGEKSTAKGFYGKQRSKKEAKEKKTPTTHRKKG